MKKVKFKFKIRFIFYLAFILIFFYGRSLWHPIYIKIVGKRTSEEVYQKYHSRVDQELHPLFEALNLTYPPKVLTLIAIKEERSLEVWVEENQNRYLIKNYPFTAYSGNLGPKLKEGDRQIPEGVYPLTFFNPNSSYHLSIKVGYPNPFDLKVAELDGRDQLGGDIFIHGKDLTIGCVPIGDRAIEELFCLVYKTGLENVKIVISPIDMRSKEYNSILKPNMSWLEEKYQRIRGEMIKY